MANRKILVVDDSPLVASSLQTILQTEGYEVQIAASGEAAISAVADELPDLLLIDAYMPDLDGFEVCRRLRAAPETQTLPIVLLSGRGSIVEKLAGYQAGADDYLVKEYDLIDLPFHLALVLQLHDGG